MQNINLKSTSIESNFSSTCASTGDGKGISDIGTNGKWKTGPRTQGSGRALRIRGNFPGPVPHSRE